MSFKGFVGTVLIVFGLYIIFGDTSKLEWPARLGPPAVKFMKLCTDNVPISGIISVVLGIATLLTIKKY